MKASELRLGNFVHHNENNKAHIDNYLTVCELTEKSITTFYRSFDGAIQVVRNKKDYQPIPLTEEWLLRLGFKKVSNRQEYVIFRMRVCKTTDNEFVCPDYDDRDIVLHFVHSLQNFYHAIIGQELTIKEAAR